MKGPLGPHCTRCAPFGGSGKLRLSRKVTLCFPGPRSFANRSILRLRKRNNPIIVSVLVGHVLGVSKVHPTQPNRFSRETFLGSGVSLTRTRTVTSLVSTDSRRTTGSTLGSLRNIFSGGVGALMRSLVCLQVCIRTTVSFPRRRVSFLTSNGIDNSLRKVVSGLGTIHRRTGRKTVVHRKVGIIVTKHPGTNGSDLLGTLSNGSDTVIASVTKAAHSMLERRVRVSNVPLRVVSATNLHRTSSRMRHVNVRQT